MKQKTIFFGASAYVIPIIEYLSQSFALELVVTTEKEADIIPTYCKKNGIAYLCTTSLRDDTIQTRIKSINAQFAILAYFGIILPISILSLFPKGIINIHPSLLPTYRGSTPGQQAILDGIQTTGVSIMLLDEKMDHGPLLAQKEEKITPTDTSLSLYTKLFTHGNNLLQETLPLYLKNIILPQPQIHQNASYTPLLKKTDGYFDDTNPPQLITLLRKIKAYYPWPGVWTRYTKKDSPLSGKIIKFLPRNEEILIQVEGKKVISIKEALNGYPELKKWLTSLELLPLM